MDLADGKILLFDFEHYYLVISVTKSVANCYARMLPVLHHYQYNLVQPFPWKFVVTTFLGKFIINLAVVWILVLWGKPLAAQLLDRTTDPLYMTLFAIVSILLVSFLLFFITNLDWGSVIGKWFPWTVEGRISKDDSQMGRLEESDSKGSS